MHQVDAEFMPHLLSEWKENNVNRNHNLSKERPKLPFKDNHR
jgi:hypothetical protein